MSFHKRVTLAIASPVQNRNIGRQYAIQSASWIWHPDHLHDEPVFVRFRVEFTIDEPTTTLLHVSADERYELEIDGEFVSMGPDRGDFLHWQFAGYEVSFDPGRHVVDAICWYLGEKLRPTAQISWKPGFILRAEGALDDVLSTGRGAWKVAALEGVKCENARMLRMPGLLCVGPAFQIDGRKYPVLESPPGADLSKLEWVTPAVVLPPVMEPQRWGVVYRGWTLLPSPLPEQTRTEQKIGRVRALRFGQPFESTDPFTVEDEAHEAIGAWQEMVTGNGTVSIAPGKTIEVVVDLEDYYCGYAQPVMSGGAGGRVSIEWAESLYRRLEQPVDKSNRNDVAGKRFLGFHDTYIHDGSDERKYRAFWWRAGRFIRIWAQTGETSLTLKGLRIVESRFPLESICEYDSSESVQQEIHRLGVRGIQASLHETYTDSPYYEQMMYVGDTRLETLVTHRLTPDDTPQRLAIDWFDRSRYRDGFTSERYPTDEYQHCLPFSMIWIFMIRDFALFKDDPAYVRRKLVGVRQSLEAFRGLLDGHTLLEAIPGWPWMDWPNEWRNGSPPDSRTGASAVINSLFANALLAAADLEDWHGEKVLGDRNRELATSVMKEVVRRFWDERSSMLADDVSRRHYSEHTHALALLTGLLDAATERRLLHVLETSICRAWPEQAKSLGLTADKSIPDIVRTTVYFSFYMHEALLRAGRSDLYDLELNRWRGLIQLGLKTPVEDDCRPAARSDCHAWGAHPLHFFHGHLAGVLPAEPGYRSVLIEPKPAHLKSVRSRTPHPRGFIDVSLDFEEDRCRGTVSLPPSTPGLFRWRGHSKTLQPGTITNIELLGSDADIRR